MAPQVKRLPPLIELHGEADQNVPAREGEELVKLAKAVGAPAELVNIQARLMASTLDSDPMTTDAVHRVAGFFQSRLNAA